MWAKKHRFRKKKATCYRASVPVLNSACCPVTMPVITSELESKDVGG